MIFGSIGTLIMDGEDSTIGTLMGLRDGAGIAGIRTLIITLFGIEIILLM